MSSNSHHSSKIFKRRQDLDPSNRDIFVKGPWDRGPEAAGTKNPKKIQVGQKKSNPKKISPKVNGGYSKNLFPQSPFYTCDQNRVDNCVCKSRRQTNKD